MNEKYKFPRIFCYSFGYLSSFTLTWWLKISVLGAWTCDFDWCIIWFFKIVVRWNYYRVHIWWPVFVYRRFEIEWSGSAFLQHEVGGGAFCVREMDLGDQITWISWLPDLILWNPAIMKFIIWIYKLISNFQQANFTLHLNEFGSFDSGRSFYIVPFWKNWAWRELEMDLKGLRDPMHIFKNHFPRALVLHSFRTSYQKHDFSWLKYVEDDSCIVDINNNKWSNVESLLIVFNLIRIRLAILTGS